MPFQPINTQEEFDAAVQARIQQEAAKYADYNDLKVKAGKYDALADKNRTPEQRIQDAEKNLAAANLANLRVKAAISHKLPIELADRISGNTESEINSDAEKLANFFPAPQESAAAPSVPPPPGSAPLASAEGRAPVSASDVALMDLASKL